MAIEIVDLPIKNGGSFNSYFDITRGYPVKKQLISTFKRKPVWSPPARDPMAARDDGSLSDIAIPMTDPWCWYIHASMTGVY